MRKLPPINPGHYRLSPETWAEIVEAYRSGATARTLAIRWKVAPGSVYYHACKGGWSKKKNGDERARAHARAMEAAEARWTEPVREEEITIKGLFRPAPADDPTATDPAELARAATLASGRAMKGRLWNEARALAGLAETYGRLGEREARTAASGVTIETLPLPLLYDILFDQRPAVHMRFALWGDGPETEHYELRRRYWERGRQEADDMVRAQQRAADRLRALEQAIRDLGGAPPPHPDLTAPGPGAAAKSA